VSIAAYGPSATRFRWLIAAVIAMSTVFVSLLVWKRGDNAGWNAANDIAEAVVSFIAALACAVAARRQGRSFESIAGERLDFGT
jgi:hypothetical protein